MENNLYLVDITTGEVLLEMPFSKHEWILIDYVANGGDLTNKWVYFTSEYGMDAKDLYDCIINPVEI